MDQRIVFNELQIIFKVNDFHRESWCGRLLYEGGEDKGEQDEKGGRTNRTKTKIKNRKKKSRTNRKEKKRSKKKTKTGVSEIS